MKQLLLILAIASVAAHAQLTRGFFSGTVRDAQGAVIPGVRISLREQATGIAHNGFTNDAGVFRFVALDPGVYTAEFSKDGFAGSQYDNIRLDSAQEAVLNPVLSIAATSTSITVDASASGVSLSKASPAIEERLDRQTLDALPLTGSREVTDLALLTPGTVITSSGLSSNGQRTTHNVLTVDGIANTDPQYGFINTNMQPEGTAEVHVRTSPYSAEFGRGLGAQISVVSRAGTNRFHAEAWDYVNGSFVSAQTLANKRAGVVDSRFTDHQAGASLGGPVLRDRTFFFFMVQAAPHREGISVNGLPTITIPTPEGYAALSRVPLGPGQSRESRDAVLSTIAFLPEIYPQISHFERLSNTTVNGVSIPFGSARVPQARPANSYRYQNRLDHRLSINDSLSYTGTEFNFGSPIARSWPWTNNAFGTRFASSESGSNQSHGLSETHLFGPALVNEFRAAFTRRTTDVLPIHELTASTSVTGFFTLGPHQNSPFIRPSDTYEAQDILTWTRARHSLKFGAHFVQAFDTITAAKLDQWTFPNFGSFLNSQPSQLLFRLKNDSLSMRSLKQNYFMQDDWKVRPGLTVNIGVRYQTASVPRGMFGTTTPQIGATDVPGPLQRDTNDIAPRFGFAWSPAGGKTVIRGGFGIAYGLVYEGDGATSMGLFSNYPYNQQIGISNQSIFNLYPATPPKPPLPGFNANNTFINYPSNAKNPTTHFYSFSVQRQFAQNYFLEAGYTGSHSYHLYRIMENNPSILTPEQARLVVLTKDPVNSIPSAGARRVHLQWGTRTLYETSAYSWYNAAYLKFDRRLSHGFVVGASYTFSGNRSNSNGTERSQNPFDRSGDYVRSSLDRPHRLVIHYVWQAPGRHFWSGWRLSGISQWQSGQPFNVTTGVDTNGDRDTGGDRPDYNPSGSLRLDPVTGNWRTFATPFGSAGIFPTPLGNDGRPLINSMPFGGNLGKNAFRGPAYSLWNLSAMKPFRITERLQLDLRADWTNLFNHRNFGPPVSSMNNLNFGSNTSSPDSRVMQLSAKIRF